MEHVGVFFVSFIVELFYAGYVVACARHQRELAMLCTGGIAILKAGLVVRFVASPITIPALAIGQVLGTYVAFAILDHGRGSGEEKKHDNAEG